MQAAHRRIESLERMSKEFEQLKQLIRRKLNRCCVNQGLHSFLSQIKAIFHITPALAPTYIQQLQKAR